MEKEHGPNLEQLVEERKEIAKKITDLDAKGEKGKEWNDLHNRHEELTQMIEEFPNQDELHKAA
jgi:hypothetical protein